MSKLVEKEFRSQKTGELKVFELIDKKEIQDAITGKLMISSYWQANDFETLEFICGIPQGYKDIDFSTINTECLTGTTKVNEDALIAA